jgi:hypothetical protein
VNWGFCNLPRKLTIALAAACSIASSPALAVTNIFLPVADTSLLEVAPDNNVGGFVGMNSGSTQEFNRTRALMRFDLSSLPTNTLILSAMLQLEVTRQPDELANNTTFGVHRMLRPWGGHLELRLPSDQHLDDTRRRPGRGFLQHREFRTVYLRHRRFSLSP